ncbi:MAG: hypothetical protein R2873_22985 [Caldilineaceae bacterium]|nr:hypothetical protein [Caldilineaceae bacterium]
MSESLQIVAVLILYLVLFGWVGYRRGTVREMVVAIVSIGGYFVLQRYGNIVVTIFNLGFKFLAFARGGGLSGDNPDAILLIRDAEDVITEAGRDTLLFLLWVGLLLLTYFITGKVVKGAKNKSDGTAIALGLLNGIFYFSIFLPMLSSIFLNQLGVAAAVPADGATFVLRSALEVINEGLGSLWGELDTQQPLVIVLFLTLMLVAVANTLRTPKKT